MRFALLFLWLASFSCLAQTTPKYTKKQVLSDLKFLYESLEEAHYNLYAYTPKNELDSIYRELSSSFSTDSLTLLEATNLFQKLISAANNSHTEIAFPGQSYFEYAQSGGTLFPLEVALENDKALIRKNWSENKEIEIGTELLSINGIPIGEILDKISPQLSAERTYFKNAKIEFYSLPRLYWQIFGEQDSFEVEIKADGKIRTFHLNAISLIEDYESKRNEVLNATMNLKFLGETAYLNPGNFGGNEQEYRKFIDSSFAQIREKKASNLIIDLRNNGGGDDSFSDYMVSYFADKPFKWCSSFSLKTSSLFKDFVRKSKDTTSAYSQSVLTHKDGEVYPYDFEPFQPQPEQKRFAGKVYVLVNRQSYSQSTVTAAQIQDYQFGTIVGEETGEYPSLYASIYQYALPETGVTVSVSKGYIVRVNGSTEERGVIPDIFIKDHLLDEKDEILEGILDRIKSDQ